MTDERLAILVIEDDPVYAEFLGEALRGAGHDVEHVTTGGSARAWVRHSKPDAVMLDLRLPDESGYDLAASLRRELPASSIIILLTAELEPERDLAEVVGIDIVLSKPVEARLVVGMIDLVRSRRRRKLERT